jgi:glycosyltransferase involved in cell wall biosynthesis
MLIIEKYIQKDSRITYIKNEKNLGVAQSRNKAIKKAKGQYIAFLDADDIWLTQKLEKQLYFMQEKNVLMSYTAYDTLDEQGKYIGSFRVKNKISYDDLLKTSSIGTLTMMYDAKILGKFYFEILGHEDYVLKLHILKEIDYAEGISEVLAKYRIHTKSLSHNKIKVALWQWHIYRKVEKLSLVKSFYYFIHYAYYGFFKYK